MVGPTYGDYLFWYRESIPDLAILSAVSADAGPLEAIWECADLDFQEGDEPKHFISMELSGYVRPAWAIGTIINPVGDLHVTIEHTGLYEHPFNTGDTVYISETYTPELNGNTYSIVKLDKDTIELVGTSTITPGAWPGGYALLSPNLNITWYVDGSLTEQGHQAITLTTVASKIRIPCPCRGKTIRVKVDDAASADLPNGNEVYIWKINQLLIEYEPIRAVKR